MSLKYDAKWQTAIKRDHTEQDTLPMSAFLGVPHAVPQTRVERNWVFRFARISYSVHLLQYFIKTRFFLDLSLIHI